LPPITAGTQRLVPRRTAVESTLFIMSNPRWAQRMEINALAFVLKRPEASGSGGFLFVRPN